MASHHPSANTDLLHMCLMAVIRSAPPTIPPTRYMTQGVTVGGTDLVSESVQDGKAFNCWPIIYAAIAVGGFISMSVVVGMGIRMHRQRLAEESANGGDQV